MGGLSLAGSQVFPQFGIFCKDLDHAFFEK